MIRKKQKRKDENPYLVSLEPPQIKWEKSGVDLFLNKIELAIYNDMINGNGISELNFAKNVYIYFIYWFWQ